MKCKKRKKKQTIVEVKKDFCSPKIKLTKEVQFQSEEIRLTLPTVLFWYNLRKVNGKLANESTWNLGHLRKKCIVDSTHWHQIPNGSKRKSLQIHQVFDSLWMDRGIINSLPNIRSTQQYNNIKRKVTMWIEMLEPRNIESKVESNPC